MASGDWISMFDSKEVPPKDPASKEESVRQVEFRRLEDEIANIREEQRRQESRMERRLEEFQEHILNSIRSTHEPELENNSQSKLTVMHAWRIIPTFDPNDVSGEACTSAREWVEFVDQRGRLHGWSDDEKMLLIHMQLEGRARRWFRSQVGRITDWDSWKTAMLEVFDESQMCAVPNRSKRPEESYSEYYGDVVHLCETVGATNEQIMSCLIKGLPTSLQDKADTLECAKPVELYNRLLSKLDADRSPQVKSRRELEECNSDVERVVHRKRGGRSEVEDNGSRCQTKQDPRRCYNCQELGHLGRNCTKGRNDSTCRFCKEKGHLKSNCPQLRRGKPYDKPRHDK